MIELSVAIPDSSLSDEQTARDKTIKAGQIARAFSIFRVRQVLIYHDRISQFQSTDRILLKTLLEFLDTPQYLRKIIYPHTRLLQYTGLLHPIKAPHHKPREDPRRIRVGEVRTGVLVKSEGRIFVEAGLGFPIPFNGSGKEGQKLLVQFSSAYPNFSASRAQPNKIEYWGYEVKDVGSLKDLIEQKNDTVQLITSRKGTPFNDTRHELLSRLAVIRKLLVIFGSPRNGVGEILGAERSSIRPHHIVANMFPRQATETVRLEEAILGTLAILNLSVQFQ